MRVGATALFSLRVLLLLAAGSSRAQDATPSEYQLKAAFLFNFAKFVEWPPDSSGESTAPFVIGILGSSPFGDDLQQTIQGKSINNRPLITREVHSLTEATNCQILFISTSERKRLPEIFKTLGDAHVLTVGENDQFIRAGGMINFVMEEQKIRFQINNDAAKRVGLKISSKLLGLAVPPPGRVRG
jgi:hypothetical protein